MRLRSTLHSWPRYPGFDRWGCVSGYIHRYVPLRSNIVHSTLTQYRSRPRSQQGFGLIEVLVAVLILAFGMLGLLGLQTRSLALNQSSMYRSQATTLTDDILDRMRTDRANARAGLWNTAIGSASGSITGTNLYRTDLRDWKQQVETQLPSGSASITVDTNRVVIILQWDDTRGREDPQTFRTETQL
jgi:type IV pilus assembly protein PilV